MNAVKYQINGDAFVWLDEEDVDHVARFSWSIRRHPRTNYAQTNVWKNERRTTLALHHFIARALDNEHVDHRNGDGLDNRKANLRTCLKYENNRNARIRCDNKSGYKGVSWYPAGEKWSVKIMVEGKPRHVGYFDEKEDAARAYDIVASYEWGEFAWLNFPEQRRVDRELKAIIGTLFSGRQGFLSERYAS